MCPRGCYCLTVWRWKSREQTGHQETKKKIQVSTCRKWSADIIPGPWVAKCKLQLTSPAQEGLITHSKVWSGSSFTLQMQTLKVTQSYSPDQHRLQKPTDLSLCVYPTCSKAFHRTGASFLAAAIFILS